MRHHSLLPSHNQWLHAQGGFTQSVASHDDGSPPRLINEENKTLNTNSAYKHRTYMYTTDSKIPHLILDNVHFLHKIYKSLYFTGFVFRF